MSFINYTAEELQASRVYAASTHRRIAKECLEPDFGFASHVTDEGKMAYSEKALSLATKIEEGELDHNVTVRQRMWYFLSGDCIAILP